jgi:2,3-diaminopropionate biosynthesis protein SbnB
MYYLNSKNVEAIPRDWYELAAVIKKAIACLGNHEFSQPIKPFLRYRDMGNRIIAMPAFIGGDFNLSGIKWIASFPKNIDRNIQVAHSVSILNDADTGAPFCTINTSLISTIRTVSVSALMIEKNLRDKEEQNQFIVGICGFGPVGQMHAEMIADLLDDKLSELRIFDIRPVNLSAVPPAIKDKVVLTDSYEKAFSGADIFIAATMSAEPYIGLEPHPGSLHLNISLRDYQAEFMNDVDIMIVDDWKEVCRENTDIERMYLHEGLREDDTFNLVDLFAGDREVTFGPSDVVMFNPMGMAIFDIAIGYHFFQKATERKIGIQLED